METMGAEARRGSRVGEGVQIVHVAREDTVAVMGLWGGKFVDVDSEGGIHPLEGWFGTVRMDFRDADVAERATEILAAWQAGDVRLIFRNEMSGYASLTDPDSGLRVSVGEPR